MGTSRSSGMGRGTAPNRAGRVLLSAGITVLALLPASAAGAAEPEPALRWKRSSGQGVEDARFSGTVHLRADVATEEPVDGWAMSILTRSQEPVFGVICRDDFKRPRDDFSVDCRWDTTRYPDQRPSANGHYLIRLVTQQGSRLQPAGPDRAVAVNNQASAPTDVKLSYDEERGKATLTWATNPEPDVAHYDVEEKTRKGAWTRIAETTDNRIETTMTESADHRFRVAAERRNADGVADGPGPWTQVSPSRMAASEGTTRKPPAEPPSDRGQEPRPSGSHAGTPPAREKPSPGAKSKPGSADRAGRTPPPVHAAEGPQPQAGTGKSATASAVQPSPPQHATLAFSPSSADAFASLHDAPRPRGLRAGTSTPVLAAGKHSVPGPAARPAATPEPDPGFEETLPYPSPPEPESVAAAPEEPAPPLAADPAARRSSMRYRMGGIALIAASTGLLGLALRPAHRGRQRRPATTPASAPATVAVPSTEEPAWLARLEDYVTRLEACLTEQRRGQNRAGDADMI